MTQMMRTYEALYAAEKSQRFQNEGWIGLEYRLPKYLSYFFDLYGKLRNLNVLELGAGNGEMHDLIMGDPRSRGMISRYVASEYSAAGVHCMRRKGIESHQADACELPFPDASFDVVLAFDVMHHVHAPRAMAEEMVRVSRKHVFLCEANGVSLLRKLNEMRASLKAFGENSYTPWKYRSFFPQAQISRIHIKPFYCFVVPKCPRRLIPINRALSEMCERLPFINWQGFNVVIYGDKDRK